jgi:hypothetical protein
MSEQTRQFGERYLKLVDVLSRCEAVSRYDSPNEPQASTLAHAFLDLEDSFRRFVDHHLPGLMRQDMSEQEICDRLQDIGDELRHVAYHMRDMQFYRM